MAATTYPCPCPRTEPGSPDMVAPETRTSSGLGGPLCPSPAPLGPIPSSSAAPAHIVPIPVTSRQQWVPFPAVGDFGKGELPQVPAPAPVGEGGHGITPSTPCSQCSEEVIIYNSYFHFQNCFLAITGISITATPVSGLMGPGGCTTTHRALPPAVMCPHATATGAANLDRHLPVSGWPAHARWGYFNAISPS